MIEWHKKGNLLPTIITFNYDLVLERSLFQVLINKYYNHYDNKLPFIGLTLDYKYQFFPPDNYRVKNVTYETYQDRYENTHGTALEKQQSDEALFATIELLKLHGSLNFPQSKVQQEKEPPSLTKIIENPYILPPVSNKHSNGAGDESWRVALNRLREAKNVVFVGYSLPKTDIYMQFFLKAALGPNQKNLLKLFVFDPTLWRDDQAASDMRDRYEKCFAEQLRPRINFKPYSSLLGNINGLAGTTEHFVTTLERDPSQIFF